jgi:TatD DNase family protein
MIDSHAHLAMFPAAERSTAIERARAAGVSRVMVPGTGPDDLDEVVEVAATYPEFLSCALGFHPHEARHLDPAGKRRLERSLRSSPAVAVGEIGLDYHYDFSSPEEQRRAFLWQLGLARESGLPVILHQREAWDDFLAALDSFPGVRGVAHSFTEGAAGVEAVTGRGLFVGISGMVTFSKADNVKEAARSVVSGRLLLETDSPYLAPVPHRGTRNEPAYVRLVGEAVARERGVPVEELEAATDSAFAALFVAG